MKKTRLALFQSIVALVLCVSMLTGTTFAWFTDSVSSNNNLIASGILDVELEYLNGEGEWEPVTKETEVLDKSALWEPGYTEVAYLRISNKGNLALKYALGVGVIKEKGSINAAGEKFFLSEHIRFGVIESTDEVVYATREEARKALSASSLISAGPAATKTATLNKNGDARYVTLVVYMPEDVGNVANHATGVDAPEIQLGIKLTATQADYESDSFGSDYDSNLALSFNFPNERIENTTSVGVGTNEDNKVSASVTLEGEQTIAVIPEGVLVENGTSVLTLEVSSLSKSEANITLEENEEARSLNVHVAGVSADNTQPMAITIKEAAAKGLNAGNLKLYHVENGETVEMTAVTEFTAHNQFKYDPATGDITLYMATFSEVALVADTENAWEGKFDYTWYDASKTELIIANADQLAAFGAIVGGMNGQTQDSFVGKTVKLIADVNLGDKEDENNPNLIFYPIGYYNSEGTYERTNTAITSGLRNFEGTFDGNGHSVANFYQNTWEMKGDHDWYSPEEQYYRDGMGLFGKIYGGTVKNLTVKNFSSDGEIATTGVIAAYADGATFENIAIFNCNPRVYNIGNGGIVGCVGWYAKEEGLKTTFKNITVDNSNKISALWGSYDVACGGIVGQYYPTSGQSSAGTPANGGVHFENCHIAAQMDVYNDVCGNYQYYAYRYAGMLIGSVRENVTGEDGYVYPKMDGITAEDCTVHFGTWNDYYYCEFEKNGHPSYSGQDDYKFSRVDKSELIFKEDGTIECNHPNYTHTDVEDNRAIYLPFNNLVTGYGWGVTTKVVGELKGVTILDRVVADSVVKFESKVIAFTTDREYTIGEIFAYIENCGVKVVDGAVSVTVTNLDENGNVIAAFNRGEKWDEGTISFENTGNISITIQDYYFCTPTTITVNVTERQNAEKFATKFTGNFLYRVGNQNAVAIGSLFAAVEDTEIGNVSVEITNVSGNASGNYTANTTDWTQGTIQFSGTGVVKVTITDNDYCTPAELLLEVVDAVNATGATSATANNVVLLNDCGFGSLEVSGGYTLYGNGFTMTCGSDSAALDTGYSFVTLNNGTLDNVQIVTPNFDHAVLYKSNMTESGNRSETTDRTRYYNVKSGVMVSGNSQILNSRISGARAAVNVTGGNCVIDNSSIELGAVASLLVGSANSVTMRDVTLVQKPTASTYDSSKVLMGFSVLVICNADGSSATINLEGELVQNAWVDESDKQYVPSDGQSIIADALKQTDYLHDLDGDGTKESLNLGIAYMPQSAPGKVDTTNIKDNRDNKSAVPYDYAEVSSTKVYSYKNDNGTNDSFKTESEYAPNKQGDIITVTYADTADGLTTDKSYGTSGWVYELNVDLDKQPGYSLDFSKLSMTVNGSPVTDFKVDGKAKPDSVAVIAGGVTYTLTATVDGKEHTAYFKVTGTETTKESPSLVASNYEAALLVGEAGNAFSKDTWHGAAPVLVGIQIRYWSVAEKQYKTIKLSDYTPTTAGKQNGNNAIWTYSPANGDFTLTIKNETAVHSSNSVYAIPVVVGGILYFVPSASNGLVNYGNDARTIKINYYFKDNNNGEELKFDHTWSIACANGNAAYDYSDFCNGTSNTFKINSSNGGSCIAEGTLITMADGSKKAVEDLRKGDLVMAFDHTTGKIVNRAVLIVGKTYSENYDKNTFVFDDGTELVTINEHGIYDLDLKQYVNIDRCDYHEYLGHRFVSVDSNGKIGIKKLVDVRSVSESGYKYDIVTDQTLNYVAEDTLSVTHEIVDIVNSFVFNDDMLYDPVAMQADIAKYGLYTYEDFAAYCERSVFEQYNMAMMKVGVGKGLYTYEHLVYLLTEIALNDDVQITD